MTKLNQFLQSAYLDKAGEIEAAIKKEGAQEYLHGFCSLVEQMRDAQKNYFKTRSKGWLIRSKQLEKQVDDLVEQFKKNPTLQTQDHEIQKV